jgi:5-methyltetrahydrofolate--homocysteine methyltransferase
MAQPNAGQPKLVDMKVVYDETPEQMVCGVVPLLESGADIIGACCGSTPRHIRAFRDAMDRYFATGGARRDDKRASERSERGWRVERGVGVPASEPVGESEGRSPSEKS